MIIPPGALAKDDIRFNFDLGGGAAMDGGYVASAACYFAGATKDSEFEVKEAKARLLASDPRIDEVMVATMEIRTPGRKPATAKTDADLRPPPILGFIPRLYGPSVEIELEKVKIIFDDFIAPSVFHVVVIGNKETGRRKTEKRYIGGTEWGETGEKWYSTYRWQLEAFVNRIRGKEEGGWVSLDESEVVMKYIDGLYEKTELAARCYRRIATR